MSELTSNNAPASGGAQPAAQPAAQPGTTQPADASRPAYQINNPPSQAAPANGRFSPTQATAHKEMAELRSKLFKANGSGVDPQVHARWTALQAHVYGGGPAPADLLPAQPGPDPMAPAHTPGGFTEGDLQGIYKSASSPDEYTIKGEIAGGNVTKEFAGALREQLHALQLPVRDGNIIAERLLGHRAAARADGDASGSTYMSQEDVQALAPQLDKALAHLGGFAKANEAARKYVEHVLSPSQLAALDRELEQNGMLSSLALDTLVIQRLAALAKARGLV